MNQTILVLSVAVLSLRIFAEGQHDRLRKSLMLLLLALLLVRLTGGA